MDIVTAGNFYGVLPFEGRYAAGYGNLLSRNNYNIISASQSGLNISGEVRDIKKIKLANGSQSLIIARNNDVLLFYTYHLKYN